MKKFLLSFILFSTSIVFTSNDGELKTVQQAILRQQQIAANDASLHKKTNSSVDQAPTIITNSVENFIIAHPWYSVFGAVVFTFAAIKTWNYASKSNKDDENSDFTN